MTDDKDFKHLGPPRGPADGRRYTDVRAELRSPDGGGPGGGARAGRAPRPSPNWSPPWRRWFPRPAAGGPRFGRARPRRCRGTSSWRTAPGTPRGAGSVRRGGAIGGRLVSTRRPRRVRRRAPPETWGPRRRRGKRHLDGMQPGEQAAVVQGSSRAAVVLAKRHPIAEVCRSRPTTRPVSGSCSTPVSRTSTRRRSGRFSNSRDRTATPSRDPCRAPPTSSPGGRAAVA